MDCPSEEHMIRMKLADMDAILTLDFDVAERRLTVYHSGPQQPIQQQLDSLNLDTSLTETLETEEVQQPADNSRREIKLLWQVLAINAICFVLELLTGFVSGSMGLLADSLDMLADSLVYGLALFAVGASATVKKRIARRAGYMQLLLAILGFSEVIRRFAGFGEVPEFYTMIIVSLLALSGNGLCLYLLQASKSKEAHMQASMIFTSNDVIANLGVIAAGILVYATQSGFPDLIIGSIVFFLVARGAFQILKLGT